MSSSAIARAYTVYISATGGHKAIVEFADGSKEEGEAVTGTLLVDGKTASPSPFMPKGDRVKALFVRAYRDGLTITHERV